MDATAEGSQDRIQQLISLLLTVMLVVGAGTAGLAAFSTSAAATSHPIKFVYVDGTTDNVTFVREDGTKVGTDVSADIVGPMADADGDGALEAPYVTSQGEIYLVDPNNETQFVADGTASSTTKLALGDWTGDGTPEVLYANTSDNDYLYYANLTGTPTQVTSASATAVLGAKDFDGDGGKDLVFVGTSSSNLKYYDGSTVNDTTYDNFGSNSGGLGVGAPADFHRDGELWVPAIDGSGYPELVDASGQVDQLNGDSQNKAPVAGVDWAGDNRLEVLHLKNGNIKYTYLNGTTATVNDAAGNNIGAVQSAGVAGVANDLPLTVDLEANATGSQNVTVNVTSNKDLSALNVTLSGPENTTFTLADGDFQETGGYVYTATYNGSTDGDYTATFQRAESTDGEVTTNTKTSSVTVDDLSPTVDDVNITDGDGNGLVGPNEEVTATVTVSGDADSASADLTAFGAGNPSTSVNLDGGTTTVNLTGTSDRNAAAADGNYSVTATAADDEGNTDTNTSGELTLDTTPPTVDAGNDRSVDTGTTLSFSGTASDAHAIDRYEWAFGTGDSATGKSTSYSYDQTGTYTVTFAATDAADNVGTDTLTVDVTANTSGGSTTPTPTPTPTPSDGDDGEDAWEDDSGPALTTTPTPTTTPTDTPIAEDTGSSGGSSEQTATPTPTPTRTPIETSTASEMTEMDTSTSTPSSSSDRIPGGVAAGIIPFLLLLVVTGLYRMKE